MPRAAADKTTVALDLAVCFARAGYRTLAIDLDQQGNLSAGLGVDLNKLSRTAHRLLINEVPVQRCLVEIRPQLKLLPNSIDIEADDLLQAKKVNRELLLRRQLKPILSDSDDVLIDTPPAMRAATVNALAVADSVIIPIDSSSFALLGMKGDRADLPVFDMEQAPYLGHSLSGKHRHSRCRCGFVHRTTRPQIQRLRRMPDGGLQTLEPKCCLVICPARA